MPEDQNRTLQDKFMLRFPDGMRERLKEEAAKNNRSMNAEIIYRLQTTLDMDAYVPQVNAQIEPPDEALHRVHNLLREVEALLSKADNIRDNDSRKDQAGSLFKR